MLGENYRMALTSVRSSRLRSVLTLLGIIVGVVSVVTIVSLGEGVKQQIVREANRLGGDVLTVKPGAALPSASPFSLLGNKPDTGGLSDQDIKALDNLKKVDEVVPFLAISGVPLHDEATFDEGIVIGTTAGMPDLSGVELEFGSPIDDGETNKQVAVIGPRVAEKLFEEPIPVGKSLKIREQDFIVRGVLEHSEAGLLGTEADYNNAIFIPYDTARTLAGDSGNVYQILVRTNTPGSAKEVSKSIVDTLRRLHGEQQDFTVIKPGDNLLFTNNIIRLITNLVGIVAVVSMLIGGISIMNIMLVSVTERTHEIGIRKAVGASNRQIGTQFLMESVVLSLWGAFLGLIAAGGINLIFRITSDFQPVITWQPVVAAVLISVSVGVVFGTAPAIKAALKDPIEALRSGQ